MRHHIKVLGTELSSSEAAVLLTSELSTSPVPSPHLLHGRKSNVEGAAEWVEQWLQRYADVRTQADAQHLGMGVRESVSPALKRQRQVDLCEFKPACSRASVCYNKPVSQPLGSR